MGDLFHSIYFLTTQYFTSTFVTAARIQDTQLVTQKGKNTQHSEQQLKVLINGDLQKGQCSLLLGHRSSHARPWLARTLCRRV